MDAMVVGARRSAVEVRNPLMMGQDPSVVWREGFFYLVQSENSASGAAIYIYKSETLGGLGEEAEKVCVWRAPRRGPMSRNVWAPDLAVIDGRWYIYFAADDGRNENHRMYVLESAGEEATGEYVLKGKITDATDRWAIDGTVIEVGAGGERRLYFVWSGWEGAANGMQHLYIAPMSNPWTICGERVRISSPDQAWERRSGAHPCYVNEGPAAVVREGKVILAYSANGFWSDDYCIGLLSCEVERLLEASAWQKGGGPAFTKTDDLFGVGHNCFVHVEAGDGWAEECGWWLLYHAVASPGQGGKGRHIYAQRFEWEGTALPALGRPIHPLRGWEKRAGFINSVNT